MPETGRLLTFEVVFEPDEDGGYHAYAPALKGCHSHGATRAEAKRNIAEAIELWLDSAVELGLPVPERKLGGGAGRRRDARMPLG